MGDEGAPALDRLLRRHRAAPRIDLDTRRYFEIGDREDLSYEEKLAGYRRLADEHFEVERYRDFCDSRLPHAEELVLEWVDSPDFDALLVDTVRAPTQRTSRSASWPTSEGWSASGCPNRSRELVVELDDLARCCPRP